MHAPIRRLPQNPLLTPSDVPPSIEGRTVISVFNPGIARLDGETLLLLRVTEAPVVIQPHVGDEEIDLSGPAPRVRTIETKPRPATYVVFT